MTTTLTPEAIETSRSLAELLSNTPDDVPVEALIRYGLELSDAQKAIENALEETRARIRKHAAAVRVPGQNKQMIHGVDQSVAEVIYPEVNEVKLNVRQLVHFLHGFGFTRTLMLLNIQITTNQDAIKKFIKTQQPTKDRAAGKKRQWAMRLLSRISTTVAEKARVAFKRRSI